MKAGKLPLWFKLQVATQAFVILLLGGVGIFVILAMVPDSPNGQRVVELTLTYAGGVLITLLVAFAFAFAAKRYLTMRRDVLASLVAFAPMPFAFLAFIQSMR